MVAASEPRRHLEAFEWRLPRHAPFDPDAWPFSLPGVAQLIADGGLEIQDGVTMLVGENGSGKSTLIEAMASSYPRSGVESDRLDVLGPGRSAEDSPLTYFLRTRTHPMASHAGFFLRAESMHDYLGAVDADETQRRAWGGEVLNARSHGESFLTVLRHRFSEVGVYFLDEPESALSFTSCLALVALLHDLREEGSQVILATHSPILAALPGAHLVEVGEWGLRSSEYDDLQLVQDWRGFIASPERWLRHLLPTDAP
jgi:predicted ATPase